MRFRKRTRPAIYRNRSLLMRQKGAAVRSVGCYGKLGREQVYIKNIHVWRDIVLKGLFFLMIILIS